MADWNKIEGVHEIPVPGLPCPACEATGKVGDEVCPACEGSKLDKRERSLKLRARIRNKLKCEFEDWLEYQARRRLFDMRGKISQLEYDESMVALQKAIASYTFTWGGDAYGAAIQQLPGRVKLFMLLAEDADRLTGKKQDVTEMDIINWLEDATILPLLSNALNDIIDASPNFRAAPVRGTDD